MHKQKIYLNPNHVVLVYQDNDNNRYEQPLLDVLDAGVLIDDNGDDMPIVEAYVTM